MTSKTNTVHAQPQLVGQEPVILSDSQLQRFFRAVYDLNAALTSLDTVPQHFPQHCGTNPGDIDPQVAVESFVMYSRKRIERMLSILENEEAPEESLPQVQK